MFFASENNLKIMESFAHAASMGNIEDKTRENRLLISKEIIKSMCKSPKKWDESCKFNIKHIGDSFLDALSNFKTSNLNTIDDIYSMTYRFLCELDFLIGPKMELTIELRSLKRKIEEDIDDMDPSSKSQIIYALYTMPANIAKEYLNDSRINNFIELENKIIKATELKEKWDNELNEKETHTRILKQKLDEYKTAFNFVGLYQGFNELSTSKRNELSRVFWSLILMGAALIAPLIFEANIAFNNIAAQPLDMSHQLQKYLPLMTLEIILIYFFRIILSNYNSIKAQLIQIELRKTLCQFIQDYTTYSSNIKKEDESALEKFENLIFSGIISDHNKLPSTFDGLEQIGGIIKNIKGS